MRNHGQGPRTSSRRQCEERKCGSSWHQGVFGAATSSYADCVCELASRDRRFDAGDKEWDMNPEGTLRRFLELVGQLPEDIHIHLNAKRGFVYSMVLRVPPKDGWKTLGHLSAGGSVSGRFSLYSKGIGINEQSVSDERRFEDQRIGGMALEIADLSNSEEALIGSLERFLAQYREGIEMHPGCPGEIIDL